YNPATTVRFTLPSAGHARLHAFNVAGQKVATIVDGRREAGEHEVTFASDLASGVYFLRLAFGDRVQTAKAVVLR
ncbi:MAG: T9SS type A sorting domain-containing protein, partial [Candidatus Krumholzibacteria bacterium]|nr:T9SS type A sorting domain-containing protein [Candidatus Krumholzibacteria bacterium]